MKASRPDRHTPLGFHLQLITYDPTQNMWFRTPGGFRTRLPYFPFLQFYNIGHNFVLVLGHSDVSVTKSET